MLPVLVQTKREQNQVCQHKLHPFSSGWISLTPDVETSSLSCCAPELIVEPGSTLKQAWEGVGKEDSRRNHFNKRSGLTGRQQREGGEGNLQAGTEDDHEEGAGRRIT